MAVLAGLSREAYLYAVAKWIQDKSVEPELLYRIYLMVGELAIKHKWRVPKDKELLRGLTQLAIIEMVREPRCPHCSGNKCKRCGFTGYLWLNESEKARVVGIDRASWFRRWSKRYPIVRKIQSYESEVFDKLRGERI